MTTKPGKLIAPGRTASVYEWEEGYVLKLFEPWCSPGMVAYEAKLARAVHASGLPVPAPGEVVNLDGRLGLIYERVNGPMLGETMLKRPWMLTQVARTLAELHIEMHTSEISPDLPSQHQRLEEKIRDAEVLPDSLKEKALRALAKLPKGNRICHGDFHPGNVMVTENGPVVVDWIDATCGSPAADVARTWVILAAAALPSSPVPWFFRPFINRFLRTYKEHYFRFLPEQREEYAAWVPVVAAARLNENISEIQDWLLEQVRIAYA